MGEPVVFAPRRDRAHDLHAAGNVDAFERARVRRQGANRGLAKRAAQTRLGAAAVARVVLASRRGASHRASRVRHADLPASAVPGALALGSNRCAVGYHRVARRVFDRCRVVKVSRVRVRRWWSVLRAGRVRRDIRDPGVRHCRSTIPATPVGLRRSLRSRVRSSALGKAQKERQARRP